jgi:hypothetical protein
VESSAGLRAAFFPASDILKGGVGMSEIMDAIFDLRHANEFTDIENTAIVYVLRGWFASLAGIPGTLQAGDDA